MVSNKSSVKRTNTAHSRAPHLLSHEEEMRELEKGVREITQSRESALAFLYGAGLVTKAGKPKRLLRG